MSGWKPYLDIALKDPCVKEAGLYGHEGYAWATTESSKLTVAEVKAILVGIKEPKTLQENAITAGGVRYVFIKALSDDTVLGRKTGTSILCTATKKTLIVLTIAPGVHPGSVTGHERLARELARHGY